MNLLHAIITTNENCSKALEIVRELEPLFPEVKLTEWHRFWWVLHYGRLLSLIQQSLERIQKERTSILEVGIGHGVLAACASSKGQVTAVEHPSREYIRNPAYKDFLHRKGIRLVAGDITASLLPFREESFDVVLVCDVIEHIPVELTVFVISEVKRVLKRGGFVIMSTPNLSRIHNRLKFVIGKSPNPDYPVPTYGKTYGHIREYTDWELRKLLSTTGLHETHLFFGRLPVFERSGYVRTCVFEVLKCFFPSLRDEIYIVAQKL